MVSLSFLLLYGCDGFDEPGKESKAFSNHFAKSRDFLGVSISEVADRGFI